MKTIGERISKKKRANKKPKYISEDDWTTLMEYWDTEPAIRKSISAAKSRLSNIDGKGIHKHCAGPRPFLQRGQTKRGRIYGIGSVQFRDIAPSETVSASLNRNLDNEMRISSLEDKFKTVNDNVEVVKEDLVALKAELKADLKAGIDTVKDEMSETRVALNAIMLSLGINLQQKVTQTQPSVPIANPTVPSTTVPPTTSPLSSPSVPNVNGNASASPATNNAYLDNWCESLGI